MLFSEKIIGYGSVFMGYNEKVILQTPPQTRRPEQGSIQ